VKGTKTSNNCLFVHIRHTHTHTGRDKGTDTHLLVLSCNKTMLRTAKYLQNTSSRLDDDVFLLEIAAVLSPGMKEKRLYWSDFNSS
jgi:hypothetical protein